MREICLAELGDGLAATDAAEDVVRAPDAPDRVRRAQAVLPRGEPLDRGEERQGDPERPQPVRL